MGVGVDIYCDKNEIGNFLFLPLFVFLVAVYLLET